MSEKRTLLADVAMSMKRMAAEMNQVLDSAPAPLVNPMARGKKQGEAHLAMLAAGFQCTYDAERGVHTYTGHIEDAERVLAPSPAVQPVAVSEPARSLERLAARFARHSLCMSYNDSYFGEPAGELKRIAAELNRILPPKAFEELAIEHKAACALTGDAEICPCQKATNALGVDALSEIRDRRSSQRDHRTHERIQQTLDSQNSTGTDPTGNAG